MILVTGANGFVGAALTAELVRRYPGAVRATVRRAVAQALPGVDYAVTHGLAPEADWTPALAGVTAIVHAAARVHVMRERAADPLAEFRRVNVAGTLRLAEQAAAAGVRRFVFVSSIKVNGEATPKERPFTAGDEPRPLDPYGISKHEAEQALRALAARSGLEVVVIRPPLVYGPGVKANFFAMLKWLARGVPLPFGAIHNRRSLVAIDNLVDLLVRCVEHPAAANRTFLVSDDEDLSTTDLLRRLGAALGRPARLIPVPEQWLVLLARAAGGAQLAQRLCGSLCVDIGETRRLLDWSPPIDVDEGLRRTVEAFLREARV
jgi:nucleoside-diphosphate-sugar epimerase